MSDINLLNDGASKYAMEPIEFDRTWSVSQNVRFLCFANTIVKANCARVLDVGFGYAALCDYLDNLKFAGEYVGIDLNQEYVDLANARHFLINGCSKQFLLSDIDSIEGTFDCIVLGEIIEHIDPQSDSLEFMKKCYEKLDVDGTLIISTPNKINNKLCWPDDHKEEFSFEQLEKLCTDAGFTIDMQIGLWNNSETTRGLLDIGGKQMYDAYSAVVPNSLLNVAMSIVNPEDSKAVLFVLKKY